ncbi:MAG: proton-conducting membrane transporter [Mucilaginibacter sp.]|nr:MAG: proton-conducting membrane transporter [Mucilaginibacter sp.]HEK20484.1 proton-conducting membrane transporter [Bacteroidota bacterium]
MITALHPFIQLFNLDRLSAIMISLVLFVAICIGSFSLRYLRGDSSRKTFFVNLTIMVTTVIVMVSADNIYLLWLAWVISNILLTRLMLHKAEWKAAKASAVLAQKNFASGALFLGAALMILYSLTGETSIQTILTKPLNSEWQAVVGLLLLLAAMSQSALWPFHKWLTSSLNSPTPVSAIMHAGLVNGGGFLLARFAPLLFGQSQILNLIFVAGIATALLGTLWKLMQSDVKRMLACSTMGQMGFMIAQCGLGLFPAAVAHLCWHGLFKAYLFLSSGSAAKEKRLDLDYPPSLKDFAKALFCGVLTAATFSITSGNQLLIADTSLFLTFLSLIAGTQFAIPIVRGQSGVKFLAGAGAGILMGAFYGLNVYIIEWVLAPLHLSIPQPLNFVHFTGGGLLFVSWLYMLFMPDPNKRALPEWLLKAYVKMLNTSQPHRKTITASRNEYQF